MKRKGFLLLAILIPLAWIVSQLLPVLLMHNLLINYRVHFETYGLLEFARMIGALVWWYIIELSIALVIIQLASQLLSAISTPRFREGLLKVTAILFSLFISAYFLLLNLSWYWHSSYGNFLQITTLTKVLSLVDLKSSASVLAPADMFLALILSLASITIWCLSFLLIRALQTKKKICHECLRICSFLILLLLPAVASILLLRESDSSSLHSQRLSHEYRFHLSPQFAFISDLLEDDGEVAGHAFLSSISLDTSESYEDYLQRVAEKPLRNVFVFLVEALRSDIIFKRFEDKEITPHLNQLAKKSSFFPLGFSHSAETSFGQISLLTGQHPIMQSKLMAANLDLQRNKFLLHELFHELGYHSVYLSHHWSKTAEILKPSPNRINLYFDRRVHGLSRLESDLLASNPSVIEEEDVPKTVEIMN